MKQELFSCFCSITIRKTLWFLAKCNSKSSRNQPYRQALVQNFSSILSHRPVKGYLFWVNELSATDRKLSDNSIDLNFNAKIILQPQPPIAGHHSCVQNILTHVFENIFCQFSYKSSAKSEFFVISLKSVLNGVCCDSFGLIFRLLAFWWKFRFSLF